MSYFVYRCYDADGVLLYIGCTYDLKSRMRQHARGQGRASRVLSHLMASYTTEGPYSHRVTAEEAEREAIRTEDALLNIQNAQLPAWQNDSRLERYLNDRALPLAIGGLHRCPDCQGLRGHHMPFGLCQDCISMPGWRWSDDWIEAAS